MTELTDLYQEMILDHAKRPRNFAVPAAANLQAEGHNPLCGDRLTVGACEREGVLDAVGFEGQGCALCLASASTMTESVRGKSCAQIGQLFRDFRAMVTGGKTPEDSALPPKLCAFAGVSAFPMRVKCTTLAWHTLLAAMAGQARVSTEG
jgi:nitrogen fixation NifU-like protein